MYFIIHNSYDAATKYSITSTEKNVKLSYLIGSVVKSNVYFHMTFLLPKYWKLLSLTLSHTFIDHAAKHKKIINNNITTIIIIIFTVCLKYHKQKRKRNLQWNNRSWQSDWNSGCWNTLDTSTTTNSFT